MELVNNQKILQNLVEKAWKDNGFKNELVQNPVATIESYLGQSVDVPKGKKIAFIDQTDDSTIYFAIPPQPRLDDMELDETQLDIISGGDGGGIILKP